MVTVMVNDGTTGFLFELGWDIDAVEDELRHSFGCIYVVKYEIEEKDKLLGTPQPPVKLP